MFTQVNGGLAFGFLQRNNIAPTAGLRFRFWKLAATNLWAVVRTAALTQITLRAEHTDQGAGIEVDQERDRHWGQQRPRWRLEQVWVRCWHICCGSGRLEGLVDGQHFFDPVADEAIFEFRYHFPGWPQKLGGRGDLMALYAGYGDNIILHDADGLIVHRCQDPCIVILEYEVHGKVVATGALYENRFISVVTISNRKIVHWRDYMDSLAAMNALAASAMKLPRP
jgi:ketosteroid isomerase-like protein